MKQEQRNRRVRRVVLVLMIAITAFAADYFAYPYRTHISAPTLNKGENGIWVRHTWADSPHTDAEYAALASRFTELQVRKAYIHLRSVDATGIKVHLLACVKLRQMPPGTQGLMGFSGMLSPLPADHPIFWRCCAKRERPLALANSSLSPHPCGSQHRCAHLAGRRATLQPYLKSAMK